MSNSSTNQAVQSPNLPTNKPHLLSSEEIEHPETIITSFCENNYLDRMKTIFWEVVSIAASTDYDYWEDFTPREMLAFYNKVDLFLEAAYLLCQKMEGNKKGRKHGVVQCANLPKRLDDERIYAPESVIADFFKDSSLEEIRDLMHEIVIQAVCSTDLGSTTLARRDMVWFCEQIETLIQGLFILNPQIQPPSSSL